MKRNAAGEEPASSLSVENSGGLFACLGIKNHKSGGMGVRQNREEPSSMASLAEEWKQLSLKERELVQEEVHGVASGFVADETEQLIESSLRKMDEEVQKIRKKPAYDRAVFLNPSYVKDRDFRLMFLRVENFEARKAAHRIIAYFETKLELFGVGRLAKPLTFDDLDKDSQDYMMAGPVQVRTCLRRNPHNLKRRSRLIPISNISC